METSLLSEWDNFYVIVGSSAAGLTGLTFVVIAIAAEAKKVNLRGLKAYVSPTIVHFGAVLALAAYLSMPHQGVPALCFGFGAAGIAGLAYVTFIAASMRHISKDYAPVREDWIWNVLLPAGVYAVLLACAFVVWRHEARCLLAAAVAILALMFIGIHNAWDIAVWNTVRNRDDSQ